MFEFQLQDGNKIQIQAFGIKEAKKIFAREFKIGMHNVHTIVQVR